MSAREVTEAAMKVAARICIYTNDNFHFEELG
jgi:ATP-dependent protease HslVU (ClpYQ) peptidase subunit